MRSLISILKTESDNKRWCFTWQPWYWNVSKKWGKVVSMKEKEKKKESRARGGWKKVRYAKGDWVKLAKIKGGFFWFWNISVFRVQYINYKHTMSRNDWSLRMSNLRIDLIDEIEYYILLMKSDSSLLIIFHEEKTFWKEHIQFFSQRKEI